MSRILVVEDNDDLAFGLRASLEGEGHEVHVAPDGNKGLALARALRPALLVLDVMLPGVDGFTVLRTLRGESFDAPVLILTARGAETDIVHGFNLGADDYVTKPFGLAVLLARVRALLRRGGPPNDERLHEFGDISVDVATRSVTRGGHLVALTFKEFDLLVALLERHGTVVTRRQLLEEVWEHQAEVQTRTVDMHVAELRRKLEPDPAHPKYILTVWKVGYRLER
jgi:DNA-binding response OmpR family regulator